MADINVLDREASQGRWGVQRYSQNWGCWYLHKDGDGDGDTFTLDSRQDCEDLIALLNAVKERL